MLRILSEWRTESAENTGVERSVCDCIAAMDARRESDAPRWLRRVAEELDDTAVSPPPVTDLAGREGLHPVSLARLFRRHFGTSITERIRRRRVERAAGLLAADSAGLAEIALNTGFADQSHLSRVFRRETGLTPGAYRRLARPA
jgi:AraC family transcriptional regulator